jgi:hypothetical protein
MILKDKQGNRFGEIETDRDGRQIARDVYGNRLGYYEPRYDATYDKNGNRFGEGNQLSWLIGIDHHAPGLTPKSNNDGGGIILIVLLGIYGIAYGIYHLACYLEKWNSFSPPYKQVVAFYHYTIIVPLLYLGKALISIFIALQSFFCTNTLTPYPNINFVLFLISSIIVVLILTIVLKIIYKIAKPFAKKILLTISFILATPIVFSICYYVYCWLTSNKIKS